MSMGFSLRFLTSSGFTSINLSINIISENVLLWLVQQPPSVQHIAIDFIPKHIWYNEPYKSNNSASKPFSFKNTESYSYSKEDYVLWEMPEDKLSVCFFTTGV